MPVIPQISEGIKTGLKFNPGADPKIVAVTTASSQAAMASTSFQPAAPVPLPVIPFGLSIGIIMGQIEAAMNKSYEEAGKISARLMKDYERQAKKAEIQQESAVDELYDDEKTRQNEIKEEISTIEQQISVLEEEIIALQKKQDEERTAYMAEVFIYKEQAKIAEEEKNSTKRDEWISKIDDLEYWLAEIILMVIEIVNKTIEIMQLKRDLENYQELAGLSIQKNWEWLEDKATDFEVSVPYYPDTPLPPNLPPTTPQMKESKMAKFGRQIFAKWIVTPTMPPIGLIVAAIQMVIQSYAPSTPPPLAAKTEAQTDSLILKIGGAF